jgi:hypothetical protein
MDRHIEGSEDLLDLETIRCWNGEDGHSTKADVRHHCTTLKEPLTPAPHRDAAVRIVVGWLPRGPVAVGFTAGASTPDAVTAEVVERLLSLGDRTAR